MSGVTRVELVTAAQMREFEQGAVAAGISLDALMENAGLAVARALRDEFDPLSAKRICVLVGPGNNGGDGLVAARRLAAWGADATAYVVAGRPDPDPKLRAAADAGVAITEAATDPELSRLRELCRNAHVVLDAVLGTGRARPIGPDLARQLAVARESIAAGGARVVAVDVPTGVNSDTGEIDPHAMAADEILMLGRPKLGPFLRPVVDPSRAVQTLAIGLPDRAQSGARTELMTDALAASLVPERRTDAHKGTFGRALVLAGSPGFVGAARLAATAAGRVGAGLVTLAAPLSVYTLVAPGLADATYVPLPETEPGETDAGAALAVLHPAVEAASALLIGPGLGQAPMTKALLHQLLSGRRHLPPSVLDADCLNYLATVAGWWRRISAPTVVTPHPGEMARLTGRSIAEVQAGRLEIATRSAREWRTVVVLKGACTVVAHPDGRARISPFANSGLATAGTGDVLAGAIAGVMAQGVNAFDAATLGVFLHGAAGDIARDAFGEAGMVASDLLDRIPAATLALSGGCGPERS